MTYRGHVKDGVIVLDDDCTLPEGTPVEVVPVPAAEQAPSVEHKKQSFYERYKEFFGCIDDLPSDFAANHDHYIHGTPKRE